MMTLPLTLAPLRQQASPPVQGKFQSRNITKIPDELLRTIFRFIKLDKEKQNILFVCKRWHRVGTDTFAESIFTNEKLLVAYMRNSMNTMKYLLKGYKNESRNFTSISCIASDYMLNVLNPVVLSEKIYEVFPGEENAFIKVGNDGLFLEHIPAFQGNKDVVLTAVKQNGYALRFASEVLQNDKDVVLAAVRQNRCALQYASKVHRGTRKDVARIAVEKYGVELRCAGYVLQKSAKAMLTAVNQYDSALADTNEVFRNDKEAVLDALNENAARLKYCSRRFYETVEAVFAFVKNRNTIRYAVQALQSDTKIVLVAVKENGSVLQKVCQALRYDLEVMCAIEDQSRCLLDIAGKALQNDKEIVLAIVQGHGDVFRFASKTLQNGEEIVRVAKDRINAYTRSSYWEIDLNVETFRSIAALNFKRLKPLRQTCQKMYIKTEESDEIEQKYFDNVVADDWFDERYDNNKSSEFKYAQQGVDMERQKKKSAARFEREHFPNNYKSWSVRNPSTAVSEDASSNRHIKKLNYKRVARGRQKERSTEQLAKNNEKYS